MPLFLKSIGREDGGDRTSGDGNCLFNAAAAYRDLLQRGITTAADGGSIGSEVEAAALRKMASEWLIKSDSKLAECLAQETLKHMEEEGHYKRKRDARKVADSKRLRMFVGNAVRKCVAGEAVEFALCWVSFVVSMHALPFKIARTLRTIVCALFS